MGSDVPSLAKHATKCPLVRWTAASGDLNELHYDKDHAAKIGFPEVIVHGRVNAAFLRQLMTDWIGHEGKLKRFSFNIRENGSTTTPETAVVVLPSQAQT